MSELHQFSDQDKENLLFALNKCASVDKKEDAVYELKGKVMSAYQRNEKVYRVNFNESKEVYMFVFDDNDKFKAIIKGIV